MASNPDPAFPNSETFRSVSATPFKNVPSLGHVGWILELSLFEHSENADTYSCCEECPVDLN